MNARLQVESISKNFGDTAALSDVNFTIDAGQIVALLGHNGAGKTTLARIMAGLLMPTSGRIVWEGIDIEDSSARSDGTIGYVGQEVAIYPRSTVRANLEFFAGISRRPAMPLFDLASQMGLSSLMGKRAIELSGGQRRRLHAAIGLIAQPDLLLMDEPTAGADAETRDRLLDVLRSYSAGGGAVLYTTHYTQEVEVLDPTIVVMREGRLVAEGNVQEIVALAGPAVFEITFEGEPLMSWPDGWSQTGPQACALPAQQRTLSELLGEAEELGLRPIDAHLDEPSLDRALRLLGDQPTEDSGE